MTTIAELAADPPNISFGEYDDDGKIVLTHCKSNSGLIACKYVRSNGKTVTNCKSHLSAQDIIEIDSYKLMLQISMQYDMQDKIRKWVVKHPVEDYTILAEQTPSPEIVWAIVLRGNQVINARDVNLIHDIISPDFDTTFAKMFLWIRWAVVAQYRMEQNYNRLPPDVPSGFPYLIYIDTHNRCEGIDANYGFGYRDEFLTSEFTMDFLMKYFISTWLNGEIGGFIYMGMTQANTIRPLTYMRGMARMPLTVAEYADQVHLWDEVASQRALAHQRQEKAQKICRDQLLSQLRAIAGGE